MSRCSITSALKLGAFGLAVWAPSALAQSAPLGGGANGSAIGPLPHSNVDVSLVNPERIVGEWYGGGPAPIIGPGDGGFDGGTPDAGGFGTLAPTAAGGDLLAPRFADPALLRDVFGGIAPGFDAGGSIPTGPAPGGGAPIPEPASALLLLAGAPLLRRRR